MHDRKLLSVVAVLGGAALVGFFFPSRPNSRRTETLTIASPCVLERFNQKTLSWEKISQGMIRSKDLIATGAEGCEVETAVGALELGPKTITAVERSEEGWVAEVQSGRVLEIGSHHWQIVSPGLRNAPIWFSPSLRVPPKRL